MQFLTVLALAGAAVAVPANIMQSRQAGLCSGLSGTPQCCATDVLGVVALDCANPPTVPTTTEEFVNSCADIGQQARCCTLPILEQALICSEPIGFPGAPAPAPDTAAQ